MKRTCKECRAREFNFWFTRTPPFESSCNLGYKQENGKPQEECPKPLTWAQLKAEEKKQWQAAKLALDK